MRTSARRRLSIPKTLCRALLWQALPCLALVALAPLAAKDDDKPSDPASEPAAETRGIVWAASFEAAVEASKKGERPLLIDFGAEWCGWCKKLDRETFQDAKVIQFVKEFFVAVKVDADQRGDLVQQFKVTGFPTLIVRSPDGQVLQKLSGFRGPEDLLSEIRKSAESAGSLKKLRDLAAAAPDDVDAQRAYARAVFGAGSAKEAAEVLEKVAEKHPKDSGILLDLADMHRTAKNAERARELYGRVIELADPEHPETLENAGSAYVPLARLLIGARKLEEAKAHLTRFLEDYPRSEQRLESLMLRSYASSILDDAEGALADLQTIVDTAPESPLGIHAGRIIDTVQRNQ